MNEESNVKGEIIKGTVEVIKTAYDDALKPFAGETGKALGTIGQTVNVALAPMRGLVWGYGEIETWLKATVARKLEKRGISQNQIITPDPDIAVPAIEALRYTKLREEYANLLTSAMDATTSQTAHPAFVELLKQITPDEERIIAFLPPLGGHVPTIDLDFSTPGKGDLPLYVAVNTIDEDAKCLYPEAVGTYMNNLSRLGITEIPVDKVFVDESRYDRIKALPVYVNAAREIPPGTRLVPRLRIFGLTVLGQGFKDVCIGSPDIAASVPNLSQTVLRSADWL